MKTILLAILLSTIIYSATAQTVAPDSATQAMMNTWKAKQKKATSASLSLVGLGAISIGAAAIIASNAIYSNTPVVFAVIGLSCMIASAPFGWVAIHFKRLRLEQEKLLRNTNVSIGSRSVTLINSSQLSSTQQINISLHIPLGR